MIDFRDKRKGKWETKLRIRAGLHKEHRKKGARSHPLLRCSDSLGLPQEKQPGSRGACGEERRARREEVVCSGNKRTTEENNKLNYRKICRKRICCRRGSLEFETVNK